MDNKLNIILNDQIVKGNEGETILEVARRHGLEIPTLCDDPRLQPFTSCYVCVVEVEGMRGMQPSCSTRITEGMKIHTHNEKVLKARKTALELMLSNHYADCAGPCKQTCPAGVDVQGYISLIEKGLYNDAVAVIKETNPLPAICGRVCVRPCEVACRRNLLDEGAPVGIDYLKRFASDIDLDSDTKFKPLVKPETGKSVAVIGAGPGGLSAAFFLRKEGHGVDIFEASPAAGGWLRYGIPEYRLPNDLLQKEVDNITEMGVNIHYNQRLGENISYRELKQKYNATILAIGSQKGTSIGCEGDDAEGVYPGTDFLKELELNKEHKPDFTGKTVVVVGGGNTAMDCCRTSRRLGAEKVFVVYRRTEKEMPANPIEIHESKLEGVEYMFLTLPLKVKKDENGHIKGMICIRMELGEADASGRRRPVPIPDSEFTIDVDVALAAIGQKTDIHFLNDINTHETEGQLAANKWGDLDADKNTLQTGIPSMFAAGDGVTGPATLIQAIAQAKIAALSCHQYLTGLPIKPLQKEFLSKRENFREQTPADYAGKFAHQHRHEMPVLQPDDRYNFKEVELGYENEDVAKTEAARCLECGCTAYFDCDLKKYSTEYGAEQKHFEGGHHEYEVDFRHPYIEIDNNKCILCARCVRICHEVVGADALGLVNRGFDTYVAPSMGNSLSETQCESCGLCISTCPTGAITENKPFKPGPVRTESFQTICNYCSVGCALEIHHRNGFVMEVRGAEGLVNNDGNLCRYGKFGYKYLNDKTRITSPLLRKNDKFEPISWDEAFNILEKEIKTSKSENTAFFAGARLTNEEQYLVQKLARAGAKTNNIGSFHYLGRGSNFTKLSKANLPFPELVESSRIYLLGAEVSRDYAVAGFEMWNNQKINGTPIEVITTLEESSSEHKADKMIHIKSYYHFVKAVNHYLLSHHLENGLFIRDLIDNFDDYKQNVLNDSFDELVKASGIDRAETLIQFAIDYNNELSAVIVFSEKELSGRTCAEIFNLACITGKHGKTGSGLLLLKEKNNSHGLHDMGVMSNLGPGACDWNDPMLRQSFEHNWNCGTLPAGNGTTLHDLNDGLYKKFFIFGEDPVGCATDTEAAKAWIQHAGFTLVQDYFITETALLADLILPASLPWETGGTFTNTQKVIQKIDQAMPSRLSYNGWQQVNEILSRLGLKNIETVDDVIFEVASLLPKYCTSSKLKFRITQEDNFNPMFNHGCDIVNKRFDEEFKNAFE
ncbi:MAG: FAD-dependent oxidoreductase [Lentimicrobium sp.]|jgi:formate dehydrogenase major subunit|nr:FAD-dependent oxidoreductase [Lentimicrobium sp.]